MVTNCEFCAFYVYDDDGYAECDVNLDEDEIDVYKRQEKHRGMIL